MSECFALRARVIFPVARDPIANGVITIADDRILAVGENVSGQSAVDLGDMAIVPGLVNTHAHLEFSQLPRPLGVPGMVFPDWIRQVVRWRRSNDLPAAAPCESGLQESLASGTTTIGEIATSNWFESVTTNPGSDLTLFHEFIGRSSEQITACLAKARLFLSTRPNVDGWTEALCPHASYSVHPELFARLVSLSVEHRVPIAFHLAESREELEYIRSGTGPFDVLLRDLGVPQDGPLTPHGTRPLDYLRVMSQSPRSLVIHGNYLEAEEQTFVADHRDRMAVIYCPRTHAYFGHSRHPIAELLAAGANVALGTDSRASNPDLSLWNEMRFVADHFPQISPRSVLELGTIRGAYALGRGHEIGTLEPGKLANLAIVSLGAMAHDPHEALFGADSRVIRTMHRGTWVA
jgi:cytosine/adenosine deaminase-related metal-dependent hydrolase